MTLGPYRVEVTRSDGLTCAVTVPAIDEATAAKAAPLLSQLIDDTMEREGIGYEAAVELVAAALAERVTFGRVYQMEAQRRGVLAL